MADQKNIFVELSNYKKAAKNVSLKERFTFVFFLGLQFLLGINLGFYRIKSSKAILIQLLSLIPILFIISLALYVFKTNTGNRQDFTFWVFYVTIQHLFSLFPLHFCGTEYTLFSGRRNLRNVSKQLQMRAGFWDSDLGMIFLSSLLMICMFSISFIFCVIVPSECFYSKFIHVIILLITFSLHVPLVIYSYFFFYVYQHLVKIKTYILKNTACDWNFAQEMYKCLIDLTEKTRRGFDRMFIASLTFKVIEVMISLYKIIMGFKEKSLDPVYCTLGYSWLLLYLILVFVPAALGTFMSYQAQQINIVLQERKLIQIEKEDEIITRFSAYIKARPFKFHIFYVITMDATLPFLITNVAATYLIVALQFSHMY